MDAPDVDYHELLKEFPCSFNLINGENISTTRLKTTEHNLLVDKEIENWGDEKIRNNNLLTWIYFRLNKKNQANDLSEKVVKWTDWKNITSLANRVFLKFNMGDEVEAEKCFKLLEKIKSSENFLKMLVEAKAEQAYSYSRLGGPNNLILAIQLFSEAIKEVPDNFLWKFGLGLVYRRATHANIFCSSPNRTDVDEYKKKAIENLFDVAHNTNNYLQAMAYAQLANLRQNHPPCRYTEYDVLFQYLSAQELCSKALEKGSDTAQVLTHCGKVLRSLDIEKSIELLEKSTRLQDKSIAYHYLGKSYVRKAEQQAKANRKENSFYNQTSPQPSKMHGNCQQFFPEHSEAFGACRQLFHQETATSRSYNYYFSHHTETRDNCRSSFSYSTDTRNTYRPSYPHPTNTLNTYRPWYPHPTNTRNTYRPWYPHSTDTRNTYRPWYPHSTDTRNTYRPWYPHSTDTHNTYRPSYPHPTDTGTPYMQLSPQMTYFEPDIVSDSVCFENASYSENPFTFSQSPSRQFSKNLHRCEQRGTNQRHQQRTQRGRGPNFGGRPNFRRSFSHDSNESFNSDMPLSYRGKSRGRGQGAHRIRASVSEGWSPEDSIGSYVQNFRKPISLAKDNEYVIKAVNSFLKAIEIAEENLSAFLDLGLLYTRTGQLEEALIQFNRITNSNRIKNDQRLVVISAYEQAGLCYLELSKTANDSNYEEVGKKKLTTAVRLAADLAVLIPELKDCAHEFWEAFRTLENEIDRKTPSSNQLREKIDLLNIIKACGPIVEVVKKLRELSEDDVCNSAIITITLNSYLKLGQPENALAFQNVITVNPIVRESEWWTTGALLDLRVKVLIEAITGSLKDSRENATGLFQQLFKLCLGDCIGLHDKENQEHEDPSGFVRDLLVLYDDEDNDCSCPTGKAARSLKIISTCLYGLDAEENLEGNSVFGDFKLELQLREAKKYLIVMLVLGGEKRIGQFEAILKCLGTSSTETTKQRIVVVDAGLRESQVPLCLKQYDCFKLEDIGGLGDIDHSPGDSRDRVCQISFMDILQQGFHGDVDAITKLFCFLIGKQRPCS